MMNPNTGDLVGHLSGDLRVRDRVERWFNRRYTASRRDTYLIRTDTGWQVLGREGGADGREVTPQSRGNWLLLGGGRRMVEVISSARLAAGPSPIPMMRRYADHEVCDASGAVLS